MSLEKLEQIEVKKFNFKGDEKEYIGFIAQELHKVFPQAVIEGDETTPWKVDYLQIIPLIINSIKELNERVRKLEETEREKSP